MVVGRRGGGGIGSMEKFNAFVTSKFKSKVRFCSVYDDDISSRFKAKYVIFFFLCFSRFCLSFDIICVRMYVCLCVYFF